MHCIASIILFICAIYLLVRSFKDSGIIMALLVFFFGPFIAWFFIVFQYRESIVKKAILFAVYYICLIIVIIGNVQMILSNPNVINTTNQIETNRDYSDNNQDYSEQEPSREDNSNEHELEDNSSFQEEGI